MIVGKNMNPEPSIIFDFPILLVTQLMLKPHALRVKKNLFKDRILNYLAKQREAKLNEISDFLGIDLLETRLILKLLEKDGVIKFV